MSDVVEGVTRGCVISVLVEHFLIIAQCHLALHNLALTVGVTEVRDALQPADVSA